MFPLLLLATGLGALFVALKQPPSGMSGARLRPEEERLLSLLVLYTKDLPLPDGHKRYLSPELAHEAAELALAFGLKRTLRALKKNRPVPADEPFAGLGYSVGVAVLNYSRGKL